MSCFNHSSYNHPQMRKWHSPSLNIINNLIYPLFICDKEDELNEIESMPGQYHIGIHRLEDFIAPLIEKGLQSVILFGVITDESKKDHCGSFSYDNNTPVIQAIHLLKNKFKSLFIIADVCLCQYTDHGHCYIPSNYDDQDIMSNDETLNVLQLISLRYAEAGANMVAPSGMMVDTTSSIKEAFKNQKHYETCAIMPYSAKFSSSLYGPFRKSALNSLKGDNRAQYQLPCGSRSLAISSVEKDLNDGADAIVIKPSGEYQDIIYELSTKYQTLLCAYQVSGEYLMIKKSSEYGLFDLKTKVMESVTSLQRSGATMIITYFAPDIIEWLSW